VQSVDRALDLLEALARGGRLGLSEAAAAAGLAEGTAHRLLRTLVARGYVRQDDGRRYGLGTRLLGLGDAARQAAAVSGETANLAVLEGDDVVYLAQVPSAHQLRIFAEVGRHVPPHSTAVGKVLLAGLRDDDVIALLGRTGLAARTPRTSTAVPQVLGALIAARADGYAVDDEEEETGVRCVAVPVVAGGRVVAALSVSGPTSRLGAEPGLELRSAMWAAAEAFAGQLPASASSSMR
jgi:IclR family acetate operon transcriptional repressor